MLGTLFAEDMQQVRHLAVNVAHHSERAVARYGDALDVCVWSVNRYYKIGKCDLCVLGSLLKSSMTPLISSVADA